MSDPIVQHIFKDGYIDATAMCKANGKDFSDYYRLKSSQAFLTELSADLNIPMSGLVIIRKGGNNKLGQGTWVHAQIATHLTHWLTRSKQERTEQAIQLALWSKVGGKREVKTLAGTIDILTSTELIEVKHINTWINAVGQVIIYGSYYPSHKKRLHLFGETQESMLAFIQLHCYKLNIAVTWEGGE